MIGVLCHVNSRSRQGIVSQDAPHLLLTDMLAAFACWGVGVARFWLVVQFKFPQEGYAKSLYHQMKSPYTSVRGRAEMQVFRDARQARALDAAC
jgi:hypothetical protein